MSRFQGKVLSLREVRLLLQSRVTKVQLFVFLIQFVSRSKVLKLYRDILRALRRLDDVGQQQQLREWARSEFEQLKGEKDQANYLHMLIKWQLGV